MMGVFFEENPNPGISESKNGSRVHEVHTLSGFFRSNPNPN